MKILHLPNGKLTNPAHVDSITVHSHFWDSTKFYVQLAFKNGRVEDIAEKLNRSKAMAIREKYVDLIRDAYEETDAYEIGYEDGFQEGHNKGFSAGMAEGYNRGQEAEATRSDQEYKNRFLSQLFEFREELLREQRSNSGLPPDRRRYLRHSVSAITHLIDHFSEDSE